MLSMNTNANRPAPSKGNMNRKPSDTSGVVHAHSVPMADAIIKTDPMAAKIPKVIFWTGDLFIKPFLVQARGSRVGD